MATTTTSSSFLTDDQFNDLVNVIANAIAGGVSAGSMRGTTSPHGSTFGGFMTPTRKILNKQEMDEKMLEILKERVEVEERSVLSTVRMRDLKEEALDLTEKEQRLREELEEMQEDELTSKEDLIEKEKELLEVQNKRLRNYKEQQELGGDGFLAGANRTIKDMDKVNESIGGIYKAIRGLADPWAKAEDAASKYTKALGGTSASMKNLLNTTLDNVNDNFLASNYNISTEELLKAQASYMQATGRNIRMSSSDQEDMAAVSAVMGKTGLDLSAQFEHFGISMKDSAKHLGKMYKEATESGISLEKYAENVSKNIKLAQNYTFKDGIKGLESMAKKSAALKLDMQQAANFASKVNTVEGSIETAAQLQVLGGPFAQLADPMGMLNEGLNDMEGLFDRMADMVGGLGTFNKATGEVEVSSFDKQRIQAASKAMGVDYSQLMESVNRQAITGEIEKQIGQSTNAQKLDPKMIELIKNQGVIQDGKAGISIGGEFTELDKITNEQFEALKIETQGQSENVRSIALDVRSLVDVESGYKKQIEAKQAELFAWLGSALKYLTVLVSTVGTILTVVVAMKAISAVGGMLRNGGTLFKGVGRLFGGKAMAGSAQGIAGKATTGLLGKGAGSVAQQGLLSTAGKSGASRIMGGLAKGVARGGALGIVGAVGSMATDALVANGTIKRGGTGHHVAKGLSGAATGASLGAFFGPIGMGIGAAIGGAVGLYKANKEKHKAAVEKKLEGTGATLKGDYGRGDLKDISAALSSGKISEKLRSKLEAEGDTDVLKQIDKKREEKEAIKRKQAEQNGGFGVSGNNTLQTRFYRAGLIFFLSHTRGGRRVSSTQSLLKALNPLNVAKKMKSPLGLLSMMSPIGAMASIGSTLLSAKKSEDNGIDGTIGQMTDYNDKISGLDSLPKMEYLFPAAAMGLKIASNLGGLEPNETIKPVQETGKNQDAKKISGKSDSDTSTKTTSEQPQEIKKEVTETTVKETPQTSVPKTFTVNITGELKLNGGSGQTINIIDELKKNPNILTELTQLISKQMNFNQNQTNVVEQAGV